MSGVRTWTYKGGTYTLKNGVTKPQNSSGMSPQVRKVILKELPNGTEVYYFGPSAYLNGKTGIKIKDRATKMVVLIKSKEYRLMYDNLTCQDILDAEQIATLLLK